MHGSGTATPDPVRYGLSPTFAKDRCPRGFDAGKKVMGRKRHIVVDTGGRLLGAVVHEADIQDRDGAPSLLAEVGAWFPGVGHIFADGAYAGPKLAGALEIVRRKADGFVALPRRWVVERTLARFGGSRRLAKDFEATVKSALAWLLIASIEVFIRGPARL